jgi:hypothetical protein
MRAVFWTQFYVEINSRFSINFSKHGSNILQIIVEFNKKIGLWRICLSFGAENSLCILDYRRSYDESNVVSAICFFSTSGTLLLFG